MRIAPLALDAVPADCRQLLEQVRGSFGLLPAGLLVLARSPALLKGALAFLSVVSAPGATPVRLRQMMGVVASLTAGSRYCTAIMAQSLARNGCPEAVIAALSDFDTSPLFSAAEQAALWLARTAMFTPCAVNDDQFDGLRAHFDDAALIELSMAIGYFGFLTRWSGTLDLDIDGDALELATRTGLFDHVIGSPA